MRPPTRPDLRNGRADLRGWSATQPSLRWVLLAVAALTVPGQHCYNTPLSAAAGLVAVVVLTYALILRLAPVPRRLMLTLATIRFVILAADLAVALSPQLDSRVYAVQAAHYALGWHGIEAFKYPNIDRVQVLVFLAPLEALYFVFGPSFALARVFWTALGLLAPLALFLGLRKVYGQQAALLPTFLFGVFPSILQLQTDVLRDNLVLIALTGAFAFSIYLTRSRSLWAAAGAAACLVVAVLTRQVNLIVVLPFAAYVALAFHSVWLRRLIALAAASGSAVVLASSTLRSRFLYLGAYNPQSFGVFRKAFSLSNSPYFADIVFRSWADVILFLPLGMACFLLVPFPWHWHNVLSFLLAAETLTWHYPIVALAILGAIAGKWPGRAERLLAWFVLLGMGLSYGLVEANVGSAMRHRHQFAWAWFVLLPPGLQVARRLLEQRTHRAASLALAAWDRLDRWLAQAA